MGSRRVSFLCEFDLVSFRQLGHTEKNQPNRNVSVTNMLWDLG